MLNLRELLEHPESLSNHSMAGNSECDGVRMPRIGQSAAELRTGEGSTTMPTGSRVQANPKDGGAEEAMIWSELCRDAQRAIGSGYARNMTECKPKIFLSRLTLAAQARNGMRKNPVNCWKPKAKATAISSQATQEWVEGSETTLYIPERDKEAHECGASYTDEDIVRHSGETRRDGIKSPSLTDEERNSRIGPIGHGFCLINSAYIGEPHCVGNTEGYLSRKGYDEPCRDCR